MPEMNVSYGNFTQPAPLFDGFPAVLAFPSGAAISFQDEVPL